MILVFQNYFSESGTPILLLGDSLGVVIQGKKSTLEVKLKKYKISYKNRIKGSKNKFIISDLSFMTFMNKKTNSKKCMFNNLI
ncbi:MAG: hypothetical protein G8D26_00175 [Buchnera aphidicola (Periphyllus acericola)]|uniref:3-methyl-2-oxobutanoate hydroxymethyltransferase n=1 Tax=Buchnera aphidicola TaxID=9 RepID=UPI0030D494D1|nr:hypothetical protein [Buchnera aphidicola (Periphyllus acericola)]